MCDSTQTTEKIHNKLKFQHVKTGRSIGGSLMNKYIHYVSHSPNSTLTAKALTMAYKSREQPEHVMFYSNQGCHYTSRQFHQYLWRYRMKQSMSRRGNVWYNSTMERFFRSLKTEWVSSTGYQDFKEANNSIIDYIIGDYSQAKSGHISTMVV